MEATERSVRAGPSAGRDRRALRPADRAATGFTLIELLIVAALLGALAALALPNLRRAVERARVTKAIADIDAIQQNIHEHFLETNDYPASLSDVGMGALSDPWGNPYRYLPVEGASIGALRKDLFLVPINSDFDLYSMGPDGASNPPLLAAVSRDDIIRANDGGFIGPASEY